MIGYNQSNQILVEEKKIHNGLVVVKKINKGIEIKEREHDKLRFEFLKLVKQEEKKSEMNC